MKEEIKKYGDNLKNVNSNIFQLISKKDQNQILKEIKNIENDNIDLTNLIEEGENKNSILISSVYFNLTEVSEYLIDYFRNTIKSTTKFLDYLNLRNIKGYDALLYAAFRGNYKIFQKLLDNGAYLNSTNISGLNVLHLASQRNCLNIIASLMEKYIFNINSQDNNGNTALHWAVYFNNQQCIDYLLRYNIDINIKDNNNCTALQLAINKENDIIIDKIKESIIIKYNTSDNKYKLNVFSKREIYTIWMRMHLYKLFFLSLIVSEFYNQKLIVLGIQNLQINFIFIILFIILLSCFYIVKKSDPGIEPTNKTKNTLFSLLNQGNDLSNVCPWCIGFMNANSYHCPYCKKCISFQEFHNSILNNCIGKNNFKMYLFYLFFITLYFGLKCFVGVFSIKHIDSPIQKDNIFSIIFDILINLTICLLGIYRFIRKIKLFNKSQKENKNGRYTREKNNFFPEIDNKISGLEL